MLGNSAGERALSSGRRDGSVLMEVMARSALSRLASRAEGRAHLTTAIGLADAEGLVLLADSCRQELVKLDS